MGDRLPNILITILKRSGYDHVTAVKQLNESKLEAIEIYARENLINILRKDPTYSKTYQNFRFLPGHRATLLVLPELVQEFSVRASASTNVQVSVESIEPNQSTQPRQASEILELEVPTEREQNELKKNLITKVEKYSKKIKINDLNFPIGNIGDFDIFIGKTGGATYKCSVKCPKCDIIVPCTFIKHWQTSNLQKHLRKFHIENLVEDSAEPNTYTSQITATSEQNLRTSQHNPSILQENLTNRDDNNNNSNVIHKPNVENVDEINKLMQSDENQNQNSALNITSSGTIYIPLTESLKNALTLHSDEHN